MEPAFGDGLLGGSQVDDLGPRRVGRERIDLPVADRDTDRALGREFEFNRQVRAEVGTRVLGLPRRANHFDALSHGDRFPVPQDDDVIGGSVEFWCRENRRAVEWIVVAGQEKHRNRQRI